MQLCTRTKTCRSWNEKFCSHTIRSVETQETDEEIGEIIPMQTEKTKEPETVSKPRDQRQTDNSIHAEERSKQPHQKDNTDGSEKQNEIQIRHTQSPKEQLSPSSSRLQRFPLRHNRSHPSWPLPTKLPLKNSLQIKHLDLNTKHYRMQERPMPVGKPPVRAHFFKMCLETPHLRAPTSYGQSFRLDKTKKW